jgi:hypothetical protein
MNIEITNDQSITINNLLAVGKKIDAIKALREYHRPQGVGNDGFLYPCGFFLRFGSFSAETLCSIIARSNRLNK